MSDPKNSLELAPYMTKALGELQFANIALMAERDHLARQLQVAKLENESNGKKKEPEKTK